MTEGETPPISSSAAPPRPPWALPEFFQPKPAVGTHGYLEQGRPVPCSEEELAARAGKSHPDKILVGWTPGSDRFLTVYEVPSLREAMVGRIQKSIRTRIGAGLFFLPFLGLLVWLVWNDARARQWWLAMLVIFAFAPVIEGLQELRRLRRDPGRAVADEGAALRFEFWQGSMPTWLTQRGFWVLVAIFAAQYMVGLPTSFQRASLDREAVRAGEWVRMLTGPLLHGSELHIWFNVMAWRSIGRQLEALAGWSALAFVFLVSVLAGGLLGLWWWPHGSSVGASGGLCGMVGFALTLGFRFRHSLPRRFARNIWWSVGSLLAIGLVAPQVIDNAAHLGGAIAGVAVGALWIPWSRCNLPLPGGQWRRGLGTASLMILGAASVITVYHVLRH